MREEESREMTEKEKRQLAVEGAEDVADEFIENLRETIRGAADKAVEWRADWKSLQQTEAAKILNETALRYLNPVRERCVADILKHVEGADRAPERCDTTIVVDTRPTDEFWHNMVPLGQEEPQGGLETIDGLREIVIQLVEKFKAEEGP